MIRQSVVKLKPISLKVDIEVVNENNASLHELEPVEKWTIVP